jgi:AcrR family transcriptional regulator
MTVARVKNLPAEERRNVTVEAVIDLASTMNPGDITTAAIAKHMHLTQGALFRHFPDKEAIWQAVMQWVASNLFARIDKSAVGIKEPLAVMQAMFQAHVAFVADHPGAPRMLFGELQGAAMTPAKRLARALMAQYAERLADLILTAKTRGELPADLDVEAATVLFIGTIQGLVMQALISGDMGRMLTVAPRVFQIYRRGIETAAPDTRKG